jgi:hypothetical protein
MLECRRDADPEIETPCPRKPGKSTSPPRSWWPKQSRGLEAVHGSRHDGPQAAGSRFTRQYCRSARGEPTDGLGCFAGVTPFVLSRAPLILGRERLGDVDCAEPVTDLRSLRYDTAASDSSHRRLAFSGSSA